MLKIYAKREEEQRIIRILKGTSDARIVANYPIEGIEKIDGKNAYKVIRNPCGHTDKGCTPEICVDNIPF